MLFIYKKILFLLFCFVYVWCQQTATPQTTRTMTVPRDPAVNIPLPVEYNVTIAPNTDTSYSLKATVPGANYKICKIELKTQGSNIPCYNPIDPVFDHTVAQVQIKWNNKSPPTVGLRPPMRWTNFPTGKRNANPLTILMHLQLPCAQRGKQLRFCWQVGSSSKKSKAHSRLTTPITTKLFLYLPPFGRNFKGGLVSPILGGWGCVRLSGFRD